jgi:CheY-like chemotaxis protein
MGSDVLVPQEGLMPTVLIVEDDRPICDMLTDILEDAGYTVVAAANGRQALDRLATLVPDLILTDIMMPEMDGLELCAALQAQPHLASIPVIVMSAVSQQPLLAQCRCAAFLAKPFHITTLVTTVATILHPPS